MDDNVYEKKKKYIDKNKYECDDHPSECDYSNYVRRNVHITYQKTKQCTLKVYSPISDLLANSLKISSNSSIA